MPNLEMDHPMSEGSGIKNEDGFEGIHDENFKNFLLEAKNRMVFTDDIIPVVAISSNEEGVTVDETRVKVSATLLQIAGLVYPETNSGFWKAKQLLNLNRLKLLGGLGLVPLGEIKDNVKYERKVTTEEGMLMALSYLYAHRRLEDQQNLKLIRTTAIFNESINLWGDNPRADTLRTAVGKLYSPKVVKYSKPKKEESVAELEEDEEDEQERIRQSKIERFLGKIPDEDTVFGEYDTEKMEVAIGMVEKKFPWRLIEDKEVLPEDYPVPSTVVRATRFIQFFRSDKLGQFRNIDRPLRISDVLSSLKYAKNLISHYEEKLIKKPQNRDKEIKLTLSNIFRANVRMLKKELGIEEN